MIHHRLAILAASALLVLPLAAGAQTAPPPPAAAAPQTAPAPGAPHHHSGGRYMRALRTLGLSDAQKQQIRSAIVATRQANQNADPDTIKANRKALRAQIDGVLTPDQRAQLRAKLQAERQAPPPAQ